MGTEIIARTPPAIAIAVGGIGLLAGMPYAGWIFVAGVGLQALFLLV